MKENEFDFDNIIKFKSLADKIQNISVDELNEDEFDLDEFIDSGVVELFKEMLSAELSEPFDDVSEDSLYEEIVDNYFILIQELGINDFNFFRFARYNYCREIIIDRQNFDLDAEFCHDDLVATEALCAIDCLIADIDAEDEELILKKVETMINMRIRDED
ncbi:MAG: hypothetical protein J6Q79_06270 [Clostridia bacterium]|nr:hypothetical protein [Clostridia bacterium]